MDLTEGALVAGRYRAQYRAGVGGMGEVWAGEHLAVGIKVAIKTLLPAAALNHEVVARFRREAFLLGRIRSDYVARVLDFVTDETFGLVLVMEFVEGEPLARILQLRPLGLEETIDLGVDVVSALCDLHRAHVVHRDLKPGNILLEPLPGGRNRAIIVDFGISRLLSSGDEETITGITKVNMALGTVEYMAPEQILNSRDVTAASDLYAVGAMLFRAAAGEHAFGAIEGDELAHLKLVEDAPPLRTGRIDRVAKGLEAVVARALKRRPAERYDSADQMLAELLLLQDLARLSSLDVDGFTTQDRPASTPLPGSGSEGLFIGEPARTSAVAVFEPAVESSRRSLPGVVATPAREAPRGVPFAVAGFATAVALAGGALLGGALARRSAAPAGEIASAPSCPQSTCEAAAAPIEMSVPRAIDLGEIDDPPGAETARVQKRPPGPPGEAAHGAPTPPSAAPPSKASAARPSAPTVDKIDF